MIRSATLGTNKFRSDRGAVIVHVGIRLDGTETWESQAMLAENLAPWHVRIGILALLRSRFGVSLVEEVNLIDVFGSPFNSVDEDIAKEASSLPETSDPSAAYVRLTIVVLAGILPAIFLSDGHDFLERHVSLGSFNSDLRDVKTSSV